MILPKQIQNSQSGQILIVFLLILVVGLAIVLSIASRTVTDVRQTTTSDESNRAYYAAESGVEDALKKITSGSIPGTYTLDLSNVNRASADVTVTALSVASNLAFEFPAKIAKDDVAQVNLLQTFNTITSAGAGSSIRNSDQLVVYWGSSTTEAAIEVTVISCTAPAAGSACSANPTFNTNKWAFDINAVAHGNSFCSSGMSASPSTDTTEGTSRPFARSAVVKFIGGTCSGVNDQLSNNFNPVLVRIRPLYNSSPVSIAVRAQTGAAVNKALPDQGSIVTSIGSTPSGVSRKLTVTRLYPALPAIFDYVLYNGSNTPLSKP